MVFAPGIVGSECIAAVALRHADSRCFLCREHRLFEFTAGTGAAQRRGQVDSRNLAQGNRGERGEFHTLVVDGMLNEPFWSDREITQVLPSWETVIQGYIEDENDCHADMKFCWDSDGICIASLFYDDIHTVDGAEDPDFVSKASDPVAAGIAVRVLSPASAKSHKKALKIAKGRPAIAKRLAKEYAEAGATSVEGLTQPKLSSGKILEAGRQKTKRKKKK